MSSLRRPVFFNPNARSWTAPASVSSERVASFHRTLPDFQITRLVSLDDVAKDLGVKAVHLKDESSRLGLPSFKILGASWGIHQAIARRLGLAADASFEAIKEAAAGSHIELFAATDGNHGRAVARMASLLSVPANIYVPASMHPATSKLIQQEGARVIQSGGDYDATVLSAQRSAQENGGILIQDYHFEGGDDEDVPQWIVDGYATMLHEIDKQLEGAHPNLVVAPVGVGSFAQAVVTHYKQPGRSQTAVLAVEPDTAACLWKSLQQGTNVGVETVSTIMEGMNCGTVSRISWPLLQAGVDASSTISDYESHAAVLYLQKHGIEAGPCGSAALAAIRRLSPSDKTALGLSKDSVIVLLCTEGPRSYETPRSVSTNDAVELTQALVQINSANPSLGSHDAPGETAIARYIIAWLEHRGVETHWIEEIRGRPSVVGVVRGSGGGKSLMYNGHIDTVALTGYEGDPLSGKIEEGKLYGRGAADMKGGIAAAMVALAKAKTGNLRGDVIFTGVADEEAESTGTEQVLRAGWRADGAVVNEPTDYIIMTRHKGFVWLEVDIFGLAAHGSRPDLGIDAIAKAGYFLVEVDRYAQRLQQNAGKPGDVLDAGSVHASIVKGGVEASSYPALCTVTLERRTLPGETADTVRSEIQEILGKLSKEISQFRYELRVTFDRQPFDFDRDHPFASAVVSAIHRSTGIKPIFGKGPFWADSALLAQQGIPTVIWGPKGDGIHSKQEWVNIESVKHVAKGLAALAEEFCK